MLRNHKVPTQSIVQRQARCHPPGVLCEQPCLTYNFVEVIGTDRMLELLRLLAIRKRTVDPGYSSRKNCVKLRGLCYGRVVCIGHGRGCEGPQGGIAGCKTKIVIVVPDRRIVVMILLPIPRSSEANGMRCMLPGRRIGHTENRIEGGDGCLINLPLSLIHI